MGVIPGAAPLFALNYLIGRVEKVRNLGQA
jgi:hypothetical protein